MGRLERVLGVERCHGVVTTRARRAQLPLRRPGDGWDLIATMVAADYASTRMTEQEIVASNTQLVFAGNETTAKLLTQIVVRLAGHPDQRAAVRIDRSSIPAAVEEVHRYETISHSIFREVVGQDAAVGDVTIPEGERITLLLAAANRDPARWERADQFDVARKKLPHIGFAFGMHSCLGMNLARLEAQILLGNSSTRCPTGMSTGRSTSVRTTPSVDPAEC